MTDDERTDITPDEIAGAAIALAQVQRAKLAILEARLAAALAALDEAREIVEAFIAETVDYAAINNLGDPEKQHNVKWGRDWLARIDAIRGGDA